MNSKSEVYPVIFIDLKKNRIRIYKRTLHLLGDPAYIQLLVNPASQTIVVRCTNGQDNLSHRIYWERLIQHKCCELYSRDFLRTLRSTSQDWEENQTYRIYGTLVKPYKLAQFSMKNSIPINPKQEGEADND